MRRLGIPLPSLCRNWRQICAKTTILGAITDARILFSFKSSSAVFMSTLHAQPKVYVMSHRLETQELISRELSDEPIELVPVRNETDYFATLDRIEAGCVLVEVSGNPDLELQNIASIRSQQKRMQVIAFGNQWDVAKAVQAVKFGAKEVCVFPTSGNELKHALNQILTENQQEMIPLDEKIPRGISESLSTEEAVILRLIVQGRTAKEVASTLDISVRTFHYRKKSIFAKLEVKNRSEAIELIRRSVEGL